MYIEIRNFLLKVYIYLNQWLKSFLKPLNLNITNQHHESIVPQSVNYHFTRQCNYKCGFCFHTAKNRFVLPLNEAKRGLRSLKNAGMKKVNFSGGEPFIHKNGDYLGTLVQYCKTDLKLPSVSVVSNGSLITEAWFEKYGDYLDILAISCDSFDEETNKKIGRGSGRNHVLKLKRVKEWCDQYKVAFKINTVVNTYNIDEDMAENIAILKPVRWKVFQCLLLDGENAGPEALRNASTFVISSEQFDKFLKRHDHLECLVPESNNTMRDSYLILDERMRFLDCRDGGKKPSKSLLDVGVDNALNASGFDEQMFRKRGGIYVWSKKDLLDW